MPTAREYRSEKEYLNSLLRLSRAAAKPDPRQKSYRRSSENSTSLHTQFGIMALAAQQLDPSLDAGLLVPPERFGMVEPQVSLLLRRECANSHS